METVWPLVAAFTVMAVGATIQGSIGFGCNLIASPLLVLIDPDLVPGPIVLGAFALNIAMSLRNRDDVDTPGVRRAVSGMVPGAIAAGIALSVLPTDGLAVFFALLILGAVAMSASGVRVRPTGPSQVGAGLVGGFMGTAVGIGGPPLALVYQDAPGARLRGTLARYFIVSGVVSITTLTVAGQIGAEEVRAAGALVLGVLVGFRASRSVAGRLDAGHTRTAVLTLAALSAAIVLLKELLT